MSSFAFAARTTISEANSIPVARSSRTTETIAPQRAHAAVRIAHAGVKQQVQKAREQRIADIAVMPRHRARLDVLHAIAHHQIGARLQLGEKPWNLVEVVGEIRVGHHDVLAPRRREPRQVGAAIAPDRLVNHVCAHRLGQLGAAIVRPVVGDDHLA